MSFRAWWKKHFTLGNILSGALASLVCSIFWEYIRPNTIPFLGPVLTATWSKILTFWTWISDTTSVRRWWYGILLLNAALTVFIVVVVGVKGRLRPNWKDYTQDVFKGIRWRWKLSAYYGDIEDLTPFCLLCDRQLIFGQEKFQRNGLYEIRNTFQCRHHGHQYDFRGDPMDAMNEIKEEIQLNLRNGVWERVVRSNFGK